MELKLIIFRNLVDDTAQVEFLVLCPELKRLTLEGNPVCMKPQPECSAQVGTVECI